MKRNDLLKTSALMGIIVLVTIGSALLLNLLTGPKIAADKAYRDELAAQQAAGVLLEVFPGATGFEEITSTLTIDPASGVSAVHKETSGKGYVFVASKTNSPMKGLVDVTVGVDTNGKITGVSVNFNHPDDYRVSDNTLGSFVGQDSTLSGVEVTAKATVSSDTIKEAVNAGFLVLASNDLMKAAAKETEVVFEELLPTVVVGFSKGSILTPSGNIYQAYKLANGAGVVCYVNSGDDKFLAITNMSNQVVLYKANLVDEATQTYSLVDVTTENATIVAEVSTYAATNITSLFNTLSNKITRLYNSVVEADVTEVQITTYGSIVAAASFTMDGNIWNAYLAYSINAYNNSVVKTYVVIDHEGKIAKVDVIGIFGDEEYFGVAHGFDETGYENGFVGNTDFVDTNVISGATMTSNAVKQAIEDSFDLYNATLGGNN